MAHQRGTRTDSSVTDARPGRDMPAPVRLVGTIILGALGVAVIAATALLPACASLQMVEYRRDCEAARAEHLQAQVRVNRLVLAAAENDPTFIKRLALSQGELVPTDEVAFGPTSVTAEPDVVVLPAPPAPRPPQQWLINIADRIEGPRVSYGLYVLGAAVLLATMLLFAPPGEARR